MGLLAPLARMPRTIAGLACVLALAVLGAASAPADAQPASGADIKAAFLLNFAKFVEWPDGGGPAGRPFTIGVLGDEAMADALRDLARGKAVGGRPLYTLRVTVKDPLSDLHMLFIGASEERRLAEVLERVTGASVLSVSDLNRFCELGGVIAFRSERDRVRFDINLDQAERSGLVINSKLLALARSVFHSPKPTGVSR